MKAPKRRSFWQYNKDNKYWVVWVVSAALGSASLFDTSLGMKIFFFAIGVVTVIAGLIDWKKLG